MSSKALHQTAIPLRSITAGELGRSSILSSGHDPIAVTPSHSKDGKTSNQRVAPAGRQRADP